MLWNFVTTWRQFRSKGWCDDHAISEAKQLIWNNNCDFRHVPPERFFSIRNRGFPSIHPALPCGNKGGRGGIRRRAAIGRRHGYACIYTETHTCMGVYEYMDACILLYYYTTTILLYYYTTILLYYHTTILLYNAEHMLAVVYPQRVPIFCIFFQANCCSKPIFLI